MPSNLKEHRERFVTTWPISQGVALKTGVEPVDLPGDLEFRDLLTAKCSHRSVAQGQLFNVKAPRTDRG